MAAIVLFIVKKGMNKKHRPMNKRNLKSLAQDVIKIIFGIKNKIYTKNRFL